MGLFHRETIKELKKRRADEGIEYEKEAIKSNIRRDIDNIRAGRRNLHGSSNSGSFFGGLNTPENRTKVKNYASSLESSNVLGGGFNLGGGKEPKSAFSGWQTKAPQSAFGRNSKPEYKSSFGGSFFGGGNQPTVHRKKHHHHKTSHSKSKYNGNERIIIIRR